MYNFITLNPSGNITAVVLNQNIEQKDYKAISNDILNENKDIEQVGFFKKMAIYFVLK